MSAAATAYRISPRVEEANGSTTRKTVAGRLTATAVPPISSAVRRAAIRSLNGSPMPGKELTARAGRWPATLIEAGLAIVPGVVRASVIAVRDLEAIAEAGLVSDHRIESAAGISRVRVAETATPSVAVPEDTTGRVRAAAAIAAIPACHRAEDLVVEVAEAVGVLAVAEEAAGAGSRADLTK